MRKTLLLVIIVVGVGGIFSASASAQFVADLDNPQDSYSIAAVETEGGIIVGDKLFSDFRVTTTSSINATAPGADIIMLAGVKVGGDYGLRFNGSWTASAGQLSNSTIKFKVSIIEPQLSQGWVIKDNALWLSDFRVDETISGGIVSISENVYPSDPDLGFSQPIANKFVYYVSDDDQELFDEKDFADADGPVALTEIWVIKDVIAYGGIDGNDGQAYIGEFYQTFSQIPEPATVGLLVFGSLTLIPRRRKRVKAHAK